MRILIAEDIVELASILHECLDGYLSSRISTVDIAYDGMEALRMIKENEPDIVFLDIIMPKLDGIGVLREIKMLELQKIPHIIVLTAVGKDSLAKEALELGAEYFIQKPFNMQSVLSLLGKIDGK